MTEPIDLQSCVGKTFERDGMIIYVEHVSEVVWVFQDGIVQYPVHKPFFRAWLAGATEVTNGR